MSAILRRARQALSSLHGSSCIIPTIRFLCLERKMKEGVMEEQLMMQDLEVMSTARNYIDWISSFIKPHLGKKILEFGAGIGNYTGRFLKADRLVVLEINSFCFQKLHQKYHTYPNVQ